ncbi:MAG: CDP-alcohol phosphatidyltransferase family protein [Candidatus Woesearchaeota archaeon]
MRIADLITLIRIFLGILFVSLVLIDKNFFNVISIIITIFIIIFLDALDGSASKKFDKPSKYGAFFDITGDRIIEILLIVPPSILGILNPIFLIYYVSKDFLVDYVRFVQYDMTKNVPYAQSKNKINKFLISSRLMRILYGGVCKLSFYFLAYLSLYIPRLSIYANIVGYITIFVSLLRTLPVFIDFYELSRNLKRIKRE